MPNCFLIILCTWDNFIMLFPGGCVTMPLYHAVACSNHSSFLSFEVDSPNNCWALVLVTCYASFFEADLMGTRPTYLGIGKAFLAGKVRGTPAIVSKWKLKIHIPVTKALYFIVSPLYSGNTSLVKLDTYSCRKSYCI